MKTPYTNSVIDLIGNKALGMWGAITPASMGDGIKFRVTKSPYVDYVYVRFAGTSKGSELFDIEYGALVGSEYDVLDRVKNIKSDRLVVTIGRRLYGLEVTDEAPPKQKRKRVRAA